MAGRKQSGGKENVLEIDINHGHCSAQGITERNVAQRCLKRAAFPYTSLTSGVYALIDAFPLQENPVMDGEGK